MRPDDRAAALRRWARGLLPAEAAVELIIDAVGGRLRDGPWVRQDDLGRLYLDSAVAAAEGGGLSGGERRVLAIATSLLSGDHPVDLGDAVTGLDHDALECVLAALAHAGGHRSSADRPHARVEAEGAVEVFDEDGGDSATD